MTFNLSFNDLFTEKGTLNKKTMLLMNQMFSAIQKYVHVIQNLNNLGDTNRASNIYHQRLYFTFKMIASLIQK